MMSKRDDIFAAALKLFVEVGEQSTSMRLIAKNANCGVGTMYHHFVSKDELISALYVHIKVKMFGKIIDALDGSASVKEQFVMAWVGTIDFAIAHPIEYKFLQIFSHSPKINAKASEEVDQLLAPLFQIFDEGKTTGLIKDKGTLQLVVFTNGAISASVVNFPQMSESDKTDLVLMAWDAIST